MKLHIGAYTEERRRLLLLLLLLLLRVSSSSSLRSVFTRAAPGDGRREKMDDAGGE